MCPELNCIIIIACHITLIYNVNCIIHCSINIILCVSPTMKYLSTGVIRDTQVKSEIVLGNMCVAVILTGGHTFHFLWRRNMLCLVQFSDMAVGDF